VKNLAILVPSRERPSNIAELIKSLDETETESDLIVVLDDDEPCFEQYIELGATMITIEKEGRGMAKPLNFAANLFKDDYRHFVFLGDDNRPRTMNWDQHFIVNLDELETGLVYGNDLFQGEALPTAVGMTGNIVKALGGMVPQGMIHLYLDNFWLRLGQDLGAIRYLPHVVIEHLHPYAGKSDWDQVYRDVNAPEMYQADKQALEEYLNSAEYVELLNSLRHG
jgi:glycosyltransferase involved in cell wall biosynthesis